jgi:uncharacterized repeat protein (TIGR03803 family)
MRKRIFSLLVWVACGLFTATVVPASAQTVTTVINFNQSNGSGPRTPLIQGFDGVIYGTTYYGGPNVLCESTWGCGTVFSLLSTGLYNFCNVYGCADGSLVGGGVVQATNGLFYGTTQGGGHPNNECRAQFGCGTVFSITAQGVLRTLHAFNRSDGEAPVASLLQASNGNLYGITQGDVDNFKQPLYGSIFEITLTGSFTNLYTFCSLPNCVDGAYPQGSLIQAPNGNFYGTTGGGGAHSGGTLFELTPSGKLTTLYSFCAQTNCADGSGPQGGLVFAPNGKLYGTTYYGGLYCLPNGGCGTVFEITTSGKLTTLYSFCPQQPNCPDGNNPNPLILATDGNFYGTTTRDGSLTQQGPGTIFKITASGKLTTLYRFDNSNTAFPMAGLLQATDGTFYGTTWSGGTGFDGTVFTFSTGLRPFVKAQPPFGKTGTTVYILGNNLTGTTAVSFNGTPATFTMISNTEITAIVPTAAKTGFLQITTPSGTLKSNLPFLVKQ